MSENDAEHGFWYNVTTGEVEEGQKSAWQHLIGPYATREEAAKALEIARARNQDWDDEDAAWSDGER